VVFSDETLEEFLSRDTASYDRIRDAFAYWTTLPSISRAGAALRRQRLCRISRVHLLAILQERCQEVGVALHFVDRIDPPSSTIPAAASPARR